MDLKKAAITGAVGGIIASLVFGRRTKTLEHSVKYAALGAGVMAAGSYALHAMGSTHAAGDFAGWGNEHDYGHPNHAPMGFGHGGNWGNQEERRFARRS
jgi:hypothetical protein